MEGGAPGLPRARAGHSLYSRHINNRCLRPSLDAAVLHHPGGGQSPPGLSERRLHLVLLREHLELSAPPAGSCGSLCPRSDGAQQLRPRDESHSAYVRRSALHIHNSSIMQRFIKFYFPSPRRRTFQLSWAVLFFSFFLFFLLPCKMLGAHRSLCRLQGGCSRLKGCGGQHPCCHVQGHEGGHPRPLPMSPAPWGQRVLWKESGCGGPSWSVFSGSLPWLLRCDSE